MRIIAGRARAHLIKAPEGRDTRPTLDRVRENLFNVLQRSVVDARVLDLFAGSGALALEAVSRGAASAVLVDMDRAAARCINDNITALRFEKECRVLNCDWRAAAQRLRGERAAFELVFLDPPYAITDLTEVTEALKPLLAPGARIVIEHRAGTMPVVAQGLAVTDTRRYGIAGICILEPAGGNDHA